MNELFMLRALELAKKGKGLTSPNPCVAAVIVKNEKIVAEAWHKKAGGDHAEVLAVKSLMKKSGIKTIDVEPGLFQNADLYVTLEPCCHSGKTPPCSDLIVKAGFRNVFIGMLDPNPKVSGGGLKILKKAGINAKVLSKKSDLAKKIRIMNQDFVKSVKFGLPYVVLKAGMSLDGRITSNNGESKWITSEFARKDARLERSKCDCVMVGAGTVEADDPKLDISKGFEAKGFLRIVIDPKLRLSIEKKIFRDKNVVVFCTKAASKVSLRNFERAGIRIKIFPGKTISMLASLKFLASLGARSVFLEGGSGAHGYSYDSFLKNRGLIDRVLFYISPKIVGGRNALPVIGGVGISRLNNAPEFFETNWEICGKDMKFEGLFNYY